MGPMNQQAWQAHAPNLRQLGAEQRLGSTLADMLASVGQNLPHGPTTGLTLHLQQGVPLAALDGLGVWLQGLHTVQLAMPAAARAHWTGPVGAWLEPCGFRTCEGDAPCWQRDAEASLRLLVQERDQALAQVQELDGRLQQQRQQLAHILQELDGLQALLDQELASASCPSATAQQPRPPAVPAGGLFLVPAGQQPLLLLLCQLLLHAVEI